MTAEKIKVTIHLLTNELDRNLLLHIVQIIIIFIIIIIIELVEHVLVSKSDSHS